MKINKFIKNKIEAKHIFYVVTAILYIYLISKCIYKYIIGNGLYYCKSEFLLMVMFSLIVYIVSFFNLDLFNKKTSKIKKKKSFNQIIKKCILSSGFLSLIITTFLYLLIAYDTIYIDFYSLIPNHPILSIIGLLVFIYFILFVIIYFIHIRFLRKKA